MTPTLEEVRELLQPNEAAHPEIAVLDSQLGEAFIAFRDAETDTLRRFWREGHPEKFEYVQTFGILTGEFHELMGLTLPAFREGMQAVTRMGRAPELEACGRRLAAVWEETEKELRHIGALPG